MEEGQFKAAEPYLKDEWLTQEIFDITLKIYMKMDLVLRS